MCKSVPLYKKNKAQISLFCSSNTLLDEQNT